MALTKIALPMTTLNSALRFASLRFASLRFQCETKRILLCAVWKEANCGMRIAAHSVLV